MSHSLICIRYTEDDAIHIPAGRQIAPQPCPHTSATFLLSALPTLFRPTSPPMVRNSSSSFLRRPSSPPPHRSYSSTNALGVAQRRWISSALSPVTPRVHMSIFRKTSRSVSASDLEASDAKAG